jgi:hypothetical protein
VASYDREWIPTLECARSLGINGQLVGEFPLWTGRRSEIRRRVDGVFVAGGSSFVAAQWKEMSADEREAFVAQLRGGRLTVIQTKLSALGLAVAGQALLTARLLGQRFSPSSIQAVALCTGEDAVVASVLAHAPFRVGVAYTETRNSRRPALEPKREPELRRQFAAAHLDGWLAYERWPLTSLNCVEALYVDGKTPVNSLEDLSDRRVVLLHSSRRLHLDLAGYVAVAPAVIRHHVQPLELTSIAIVSEDDPPITSCLEMFEDTAVMVV